MDIVNYLHDVYFYGHWADKVNFSVHFYGHAVDTGILEGYFYDTPRMF